MKSKSMSLAAGVALTLLSANAALADSAAPDLSGKTKATPARVPRPHALRGATGNGLDGQVALLSRRLHLDARQQGELRRLLERQRQLVKQVWADEASAADHVGETLAILERTKAQIRAMLNEEQRGMFGPAKPPNGPEASVHAEVGQWLSQQHPN